MLMSCKPKQMGLCGGWEGILSEQLCAGLCDTMFTVCSTLMWAVYRSNRLDLSHWDPYAVCRSSCLELYYCNMVEWFWRDSSLTSTTNWFPSVLWHCWFGHLAVKIVPEVTYCVEWDAKPHTHSLTLPNWLPMSVKMINRDHEQDRQDVSINPFSPTMFLIVPKMGLPKHSSPYWSNRPF